MVLDAQDNDWENNVSPHWRLQSVSCSFGQSPGKLLEGGWGDSSGRLEGGKILSPQRGGLIGGGGAKTPKSPAPRIQSLQSIFGPIQGPNRLKCMLSPGSGGGSEEIRRVGRITGIKGRGKEGPKNGREGEHVLERDMVDSLQESLIPSLSSSLQDSLPSTPLYHDRSSEISLNDIVEEALVSPLFTLGLTSANTIMSPTISTSDSTVPLADAPMQGTVTTQDDYQMRLNEGWRIGGDVPQVVQDFMGELVVEFLDDVSAELQRRNKENEGPPAAQNPAVAESLVPPGVGGNPHYVRVALRQIFFN